MAFHECGGNDSSDALIALPQWVLDIGKDNQDIFFTDREGRRNTECLSWGIDKERVLKGRTGIEVGKQRTLPPGVNFFVFNHMVICMLVSFSY